MAEERDLVIGQNSKFEYTVNVTIHGVLTDLTGWTARMAIRANRQDDAALLANCDAYLSIAGPAGQVLIDIPGSITQAWDWEHGAYDVNVYTPSATERYNVLYGDVRVRHNVIV